jgi:hypothetical protein
MLPSDIFFMILFSKTGRPLLNSTTISVDAKTGEQEEEENEPDLPEWMRYVGYFIVIVWIAFATYINLLYGLKFEENVARSWMLADVYGFFTDGLMNSPGEVILTTAITTCIAQSFIGRALRRRAKARRARRAQNKAIRMELIMRQQLTGDDKARADRLDRRRSMSRTMSFSANMPTKYDWESFDIDQLNAAIAAADEAGDDYWRRMSIDSSRSSVDIRRNSIGSRGSFDLRRSVEVRRMSISSVSSAGSLSKSIGKGKKGSIGLLDTISPAAFSRGRNEIVVGDQSIPKSLDRGQSLLNLGLENEFGMKRNRIGSIGLQMESLRYPPSLPKETIDATRTGSQLPIDSTWRMSGAFPSIGPSSTGKSTFTRLSSIRGPSIMRTDSLGIAMASGNFGGSSLRRSVSSGSLLIESSNTGSMMSMETLEAEIEKYTRQMDEYQETVSTSSSTPRKPLNRSLSANRLRPPPSVHSTTLSKDIPVSRSILPPPPATIQVYLFIY